MAGVLDDRDRLFALLAWRLGAASGDAMERALEEFERSRLNPTATATATGTATATATAIENENANPSPRGFGHWLSDRGWISAGEAMVIAEAARGLLAIHDGDPARCLKALTSASDHETLPRAMAAAPASDRMLVAASPSPQANGIAETGVDNGNGMATGSTLPHEHRAPAALRSGRGADAQERDIRETQERYRIIRAHARGGLGDVFVARDLQLNRDVALKEIQRRHSGHRESRSRFLLEAEITGLLEHPGIVPIHSLGFTADGRPYYAMRLVRGETLEHALAKFHAAPSDPQGYSGRRMLDLRHFLGCLVAVCNAIEYAHSRGVIHRDLKPSNIMLGPYGETLVVDWGLAKMIRDPSASSSAEAAAEPRVADLLARSPSSAFHVEHAARTIDGAAVGTPPFMSPEQAAGRLDRTGPAADIYSLGATLYVILTGRPPFEQKEIKVILEAVKRGEFPAPRLIHPAIPMALESICLKAMSLDAGQRYASARAMADDIENWLADAAVSAHREGWLQTLTREVRRRFGLISSSRLLEKARSQEQMERRRAEELDRQSKLTIVRSSISGGLMLCEQGEVHEGLLLLAEGVAVSSAFSSGDFEEQRELGLKNLAAWSRLLSFEQSVLIHDDWVNDIVFHPDGRRIATASADGFARIFDIGSGPEGAPRREPLKMRHPDRVTASAFDPSGRILATGCGDKTARLWDAETGSPLTDPLPHPARVQAAAFHPKGEWLVTGCVDGFARLWGLDGKPIAHPALRHEDWINAVAAHPNGRWILTASGDKTARLWDWAEGRLVVPPLAHEDWVNSASFSPDGRLAITASKDECVRLWSVETGELVGSFLGHSDGVHAASVCLDGQTAVSAGKDATICLWEIASSQPVALPMHHGDWVRAAALSPDGRRLATAGADRAARIWDLARGLRSGPSLPHRGWVNAIAYHPDGKSLLIGCGDKFARRWDPESGTLTSPELEHPDRVLAVAFHPDGSMFATGCKDGFARLWDAATGELIAPPLAHRDQVNALAFHPTEPYLLTASADHSVRVWEIDGGRPRGDVWRHPNRVNQLAMPRDGGFVATACLDGVIRIWSFASGALLDESFRLANLAQTVAVHPDGLLLAACGKDRLVRLWDPESQRSPVPHLPHHDRVHALAFSPDGRTLATGGRDRCSRFWDVATGKLIGPPLGHADWVNALAFRPDGAALATGGIDGQARTWLVPQRPEHLDAPENVRIWMQALLGRELQPDGTVRVLAGLEHLHLRQRWSATRHAAPDEAG